MMSLPLRTHRHDCDEKEVDECIFARKLLMSVRILEKIIDFGILRHGVAEAGEGRYG